MKAVFRIGLLSPLQLAVLIGFSLVTGFSTAGLLHLVDEGMNGRTTTISGMYFLALMLVIFLTQEASARLAIRYTQAFLHRFRQSVAKGLFQARMQDAEVLDRGPISSAMSQDTNLINALLPSLVSLGSAAITLIAVIVYLSATTPEAMLFCLTLAAAGVANFLLVSKRSFARIKASHGLQDDMIGLFNALLDMFGQFKQSKRDREEVFLKVFASDNSRCRSEAIKGFEGLAIASNSTYLLLFGLLGGVVYVLPQMGLMRPDAIVTVISGLLLMVVPFSRIVTSAGVLPLSFIAIYRADALLKMIASISEPKITHASTQDWRDWKRITLSNIDFNYHPEQEYRFALSGFDMQINRGEVLIISGPNGIGKTTLAKLICAQYHPSAGQIAVDGQPVIDKNRDDYRDLFAVVPKEVRLSDRLFKADQERVKGLERARDILGYDPHSVPSMQNADVAALSSGQSKRLMLFLAILSDKPILLLDEWAADQDFRLKEFFYRSVLNTLRKRNVTVVLVSHDEQYFDCADRVVHLGGAIQSHSLEEASNA